MTDVKQRNQAQQEMELEDPRWSVITFDSVIAQHLTYQEAMNLSRKLEQERQNGVCIVTDEAACRMKESAESKETQ